MPLYNCQKELLNTKVKMHRDIWKRGVYALVFGISS